MCVNALDALRWALCFAIVAAAHAGAALALLRTPSVSNPDFVAGAAVVMIDLPAEPAPAPPVAATDLPLGPEELPVEQTPPPKEETKPPEQMAEVALQEPEPPKPQPPVEATAPPPSVAIAAPEEKPPTAGVEAPQFPSAAVKRWQSALGAQIAHFQRYPAKARARGEQGSVRVSFRIDANGRVVESHILESAGLHDLDQEALSTVARAQPFPKPPPDANPADLEIIFPMNFFLKPPK